jgi:hypothetical protein
MTSTRTRSALALMVCAFAALGRAQQPVEPTRPAELARMACGESLVAVAFGADGRVFASGQTRGIKQWSASFKELPELKNAPGGWSLSLSPDGKWVAACGVDRAVRVWDTATGAEWKQFNGHQMTAWVALFMPDRQHLISCGEDGTIRVWNLHSGLEVGQFAAGQGPVWSMSLSPDGTVLATGGADGSVRLWDVVTRRPRRRFEAAHVGGIWPVVFSPDGRLVATGGWQDRAVTVYEVATGRVRRKFEHPGGVKTIAFAGDNRTLVTGGNDQSTRLWSLADGKEITALDHHRGMINAVAVSPCGQRLACAASDGTLRILDLRGKLALAARGAELTPEQLDYYWADLEKTDGIVADRAIWSLSSDPDRVIPFLAEQLNPAGEPDLQQITRLIAETDHARFSVRQKASLELERLGDEAESQLLKAIRHPSSLEVRRRAEVLLQKLETSGPATGVLRGLRAVEVLERIGTPESRELLTRLADEGAPNARQTNAAKAALKRMGD